MKYFVLTKVEITHKCTNAMHSCLQPSLVHSHTFTHILLFSLSVPHLIFSDPFFCSLSETSSPRLVPSLSAFYGGVRTFPSLKALPLSVGIVHHFFCLLWAMCLVCSDSGEDYQLGSHIRLKNYFVNISAENFAHF